MSINGINGGVNGTNNVLVNLYAELTADGDFSKEDESILSEVAASLQSSQGANNTDQQTDQQTEMSEKEIKVLLQAMYAELTADGDFSEEDKSFLSGVAASLGLSPNNGNNTGAKLTATA